MANFVEAGTHAKPRVLGRLLRLGLAVAVFFFAVWPFLATWKGLVRVRPGWEMPAGTWWLAVLLIFYLLPHLVDAGLGFRLGNVSRYAFGGLLVAAAALNFALYGSLWGPALGGFLSVMSILVFSHLAIAFLVQGLFATPG